MRYNCILLSGDALKNALKAKQQVQADDIVQVYTWVFSYVQGFCKDLTIFPALYRTIYDNETQ